VKYSARHNDKSFGVALYSETMRASWAVIAFILFLAASLSLAVWAAIGNAPALYLSLVELLGIAWMVKSTTLKITVTKGWLLVGSAAIARAYIHNFLPLAKEELQLARGRNLDPAAYLNIRFWIKGAVKMDIRDSKDPTPYWMVSSRRPKELASVLALIEH
jgi:hypothetical protein